MGLEEKRDFYKEWIESQKKGNEIFPEMSKLYQAAELQLKIVSNIPDGLSELKERVESKFMNEFDYLKENVKPAVYGPEFNMSTLIAIGATGSTSGYSEIYSYEASKQDEPIGWKDEVTDWIIDYGNDKDKILFISSNIGKIWERITAEFDESTHNYERLNHDLANQVGFGISMRNVLEHVHGRLVQAAREIAKSEYKKTNKNLKWARMSDFVAIGGTQSNEHEEFVELHGPYFKLKSDLTNSLKKNRTSSKAEMKQMYAQYIEFLYSILLTLDLEKINHAIH